MKKEKCKGKTEVFSRVTGFYAPVESFNKGKKEEYKQRAKYEIKKVQDQTHG